MWCSMVKVNSIGEFIDIMNQYLHNEEVYNLNNVSSEINNLLEDVNFSFIQSMNFNEHRWYVLTRNVYSVEINANEYYVGVWEVEILKNESMTVEDCEHEFTFVEMEKYPTYSYRDKKN